MSYVKTRTTFQNTNNSEIIYSIITDNYQDFVRLINENNVNNIIDLKNGYTSLHYAIKSNNNKMIQYLLEKGANLDLKTFDQLDAYDLSLKYQNKHSIIFSLNEKNNKILNLQKESNLVKDQLSNSESNNKYLMKSFDEGNIKIKILKNENLSLKKINSDQKLINNSLEKDLNKESYDLSITRNELKNTNNELDNTRSELKSLKRKFDSLEESHCKVEKSRDDIQKSFNGLLSKIRK